MVDSTRGVAAAPLTRKLQKDLTVVSGVAREGSTTKIIGKNQLDPLQQHHPQRDTSAFFLCPVYVALLILHKFEQEDLLLNLIFEFGDLHVDLGQHLF